MGKKSRLKKERRAQARSSETGNKLKSLYVGVPSYRYIESSTTASLLGLQGAYDGPIGFELPTGCYIEHARNNIAKNAADNGTDLLLFVDSDIAFEVDDFVRLYRDLEENPQMGAVCGIYTDWQGRHQLICGWLEDNGEFGYEFDNQKRAWEHVEKGDIVPVDKAGTGFMLIDVDVFRKIPPFWFATMVEAGHFWGEDTYFLHLLKHHGYSPSCDFGVKVTHTGPTRHKPDLDYKPIKDLHEYYQSNRLNPETGQIETSNEVSK
jgi:hypothetical protein